MNERLLSKILICIACQLASGLCALEGLDIEGEEVESITHLVEVTASQLAKQQELKILMERFVHLKKQFMTGGEEKKVGFQMVQAAKQILIRLQEEHLQDLVAKTYLDEITFFSKLSKTPS